MKMTQCTLASREQDQMEIARVLRGETERFATLFIPHQQILRVLAGRWTRNSAEAEELVQDTAIQALRHLVQFRGESSFRTWLIRILVNEWRQRLRKKEMSPLLLAHTEIPESNSIVDHLLRKESSARLAAALSTLPVRYREVLQLRFLEEVSVKQTAIRLSATPAAVKTWQFRACRLLRKQLTRPRLAPASGSGGHKSNSRTAQGGRT